MDFSPSVVGKGAAQHLGGICFSEAGEELYRQIR
jgi:hypothetical protein